MKMLPKVARNALLVSLLASCTTSSGGVAAQEFQLDDVIVPVDLNGLEATVAATEIFCGGLSPRDLSLAWDAALDEGSQEETFNLVASINSFTLECTLNYAYSSQLLSGNGTMLVKTANNTLDVNMDVVSSPTTATSTTVHNCAITIAVELPIEFVNVEPLSSLFESMLAEPGGITKDLGDSVCTLLEDPSKVADLLTSVVSDGSEETDEENDDEEEMDLSVLVKSLANANPKSKEDALLQELATTTTTVPQLINFQESNTTLTWPAFGVVGLMNWLGQMLGQETTKETEGGAQEQDLSINFFIRSLFPASETDGVELTLDLTTPISFTGNVDGDTAGVPSELTVDQVQLLGFDSFTRFANVTYLGQHIFQVDFAMEEVRLRVLGNLQDGAEERVAMDFVIRNIDLAVAILLAIDEVALGSIPLGVLFHDEDDLSGVLDCVTASLVKLELADSMIRSLEVLEDPNSVDLLRIRDAGIEIGMLNILADILPLLLPEFEAQCAPDTLPVDSASPFLDFRDLLLEPTVARSYGGLGTQPYGSLLSGIKTYLTNDVLGTDPITGALLVNANFIAPFTEAQSGTAGLLDFQDTPYVTSRSVEYIGTLTESRMNTTIKRIRIEGIDSFEKPAALLDPVVDEAFAVNNMIAIQSLKVTVILRTSVYIGYVGEIPVNDMALMVDLSELAVLMNIFAVVDEGSFFDFPLRDIFDANCWLATILPPKEGMEDMTLSLEDIDVTAERFELSARCHNCTDSGFEPVSEVFPAMTGLDGLVDKLLFPLLESDSFIQEELNQLILDAPSKCRHHPDYDPTIEKSSVGENLDLSQSGTALKEMTPELIAAITLMVGLAVVAAAFFYGAHRVVERRHRTWLQSLEQDRIAALCVAQENEKKRQSLVNAAAGAMFRGEAVPLRIRWLVPVMMLASTGLFCAGFFVIGHDVFVSLSLAGGELFVLSSPNNLFQICKDFWQPGSEFLAVLVFFAGLAFPIVKNACTIALWYLPTSSVSTSKRLLYMQTLCELGKIDIAIILVIIIVSVIFRVQIMSDVLSLSGGQLYEMNLILYPMYGIYIWILGQILSQFTSQVFLVYHRVSVSASERKVRESELAVTSSDTEEENVEGSPMKKSDSVDATERDSDLENHHTEGEVLFREDFEPHSALNGKIFVHSSFTSSSEHLRVRSGANMVVGLVGIASIGLIVAGCVLPVLSVEATGFFAELIESDPGPSVHTFDLSLISIMERLVKDAAFLGDALTTAGIWFLCIFIVLTVMVMPILCVCGLLMQWFCPLTVQNRKVVAFLTNRVHSWQYTETFLICTVAVVATLQLSDVLEVIVGRFCEGLGAILISAIQTGLMPVEEEFHCYVATPYIEIGTLLLVPGVFCVAMLHNFVTSATEQVESADSMVRTSKSASERAVATSSTTDEDTREKIEQIDLPKTEFSDRFRWFLCPDEKCFLHL